jgi:hypothetical protein
VEIELALNRYDNWIIVHQDLVSVIAISHQPSAISHVLRSHHRLDASTH